MIIHFVAQPFDYNFVVADAGKIEVMEEHHDPLSGVSNFDAFFSRVEDRERQTILHVDTSTVGKAFWDRHEFLAALRESTEDVYVQSSDYYSMRIAFLRINDRTRFEERLAIPRLSFDRSFDHHLHGEIKAFFDDAGVSQRDYTVELHGETHTYRMRDETVAGLLEIKFAFTKQGDHSKPIPPLAA